MARLYDIRPKKRSAYRKDYKDLSPRSKRRYRAALDRRTPKERRYQVPIDVLPPKQQRVLIQEYERKHPRVVKERELKEEAERKGRSKFGNFITADELPDELPPNSVIQIYDTYYGIDFITMCQQLQLQGTPNPVGERRYRTFGTGMVYTKEEALDFDDPREIDGLEFVGRTYIVQTI